LPAQLSVHNLTKRFDGRPVLEAVTCSFKPGGRTAVIGENGSGKTTMLRLLAGCEQPDEGEVVVRSDGGVGYLSQDAGLPGHLTVDDVLDEALREVRSLATRLRELEAGMAEGEGLAEYGELLSLFELRGGYAAEARAELVLHGLGLDGIARDRPLGSMSGGERVRLHLASMLVAAPEVLLLDEPTNHLDDSALTWLEDHLRTRRGTTVVVSHDRVFLERVVTELVEVDGDTHTATRYGNGYAGYLAGKAAQRQRWAAEHQQWRADVDHQRAAIDTTARAVAPARAMKDRNKMAYDRAGGRVQRSLASRVRNAEGRLRRLLADPVPPPPEPLRFTGSFDGAGAGGVLLDATGVSVAGRLRPTGLTVKAGERLLVTGGNGTGKTTLLRVLAGELTPDTGSVRRRGAIGCLRQEVPALPAGRTVQAAVGVPTDVLLSLGLFSRDQLDRPAHILSTGQRQRVALARLLTRPVDVLLLDEPTNHLSLALVEELEAALADFGGAVVLVSHDRGLRRRWSGDHLDLTRKEG
jgi:macrolide transport system ATP-binding/permease protein